VAARRNAGYATELDDGCPVDAEKSFSVQLFSECLKRRSNNVRGPVLHVYAHVIADRFQPPHLRSPQDLHVAAAFHHQAIERPAVRTHIPQNSRQVFPALRAGGNAVKGAAPTSNARRAYSS